MIQGKISRMTETEQRVFKPVLNAKQTTEVFVQNGKIKLQIKRNDYSAEEIIEMAK